MLGSIQNRNLNQIAFTGKQTYTQRTISEIRSQIAEIKREPDAVSIAAFFRPNSSSGLILGTGPIATFIGGVGFGVGKVMSSIVKLPFKMLGAAKNSLIKDTQELGTFIRSESDLVRATLEAQGHDKAAKVLTGNIKLKIE